MAVFSHVLCVLCGYSWVLGIITNPINRGKPGLCTGCRKIRDDTGREPGKGIWVDLEEYLMNRVKVKVSRSYCLKCAKNLRQKQIKYSPYVLLLINSDYHNPRSGLTMGGKN